MSRSGIDTYMGHARFTSPNHIDVGGQTLEFSKAIIATGGHAFIPPIPGIEEIGYLTNETLFQITEIPEHLIIIGGGPIGAEMAQSFRRFGARVTLLDMADRLLPRDDPEASQIIMEQFTRESIDFRLGARVSRFRTEDGQKIVCYERDGQMIEVAGDAILISVGRRANVTALNLDAADVAYDRRGIHVDDHLRSITNPNVLASGDVAGSWQFTHAADAMSRIALQNALFFGRKRVSALKMPWATYTDPEVAHVGIPHDEVARRDDVQTFKVPLSGNDRAILEGDTDGFVKVYATSGGALLGGTIVGRDASAMIGELTVALTGGLKLSTIASTIHPYPTTSDAIRAAGNDWNKTRFTPFAAKVLGWVLAARR
ncbi:MAG: FAD-dependent oxidoreductase [Myxococcota bacterium]